VQTDASSDRWEAAREASTATKVGGQRTLSLHHRRTPAGIQGSQGELLTGIIPQCHCVAPRDWSSHERSY